MLFGGLWHGSSWNFVIWGAIHGIMLGMEKYIFSIKKIKNFGFFGSIYTFIVVLFSWIFFRAQDFDSALVIIKNIFSFQFMAPFVGNLNSLMTAIAMLLIGLVFDFGVFRKKVPLEELGSTMRPVKLSIVVSVIVILTILFYSTSTNFIYFQF